MQTEEQHPPPQNFRQLKIAYARDPKPASWFRRDIPGTLGEVAAAKALTDIVALHRKKNGHFDPVQFETNPGPQTMAYECEADVIGFGGAGGGGKTFLSLGLALTRHKKSVIFRREATQLRQIIDDSHRIIGDKGDFNENKGLWRNLPGKRTLEMAGVAEESDVQKWRGRAHDLKIFDEATEFSKSQVLIITAWLRSPDPKQKCTALLCFNPPMTVEGEWIIEYFAPWIDDDYPGVKAEPGELRWFAMVGDKEREMPDTREFVVIEGEPVYDFDPELHKLEDVITPKSRTFIRSKLEDNPYYGAQYRAQLQSLPKEVSDALLRGVFVKRGQNTPWQSIPSRDVSAATARWEAAGGHLPDDARLVSLGVDVARGGKDETVMFRLYAGTRFIGGQMREVLHFAEPIRWPGALTFTGDIVADLVVPYYAPGATVSVDVIGVGSSAYDALKRKLNVEGDAPVVFGVNNGQPNPKDPNKRDVKGKPMSYTDKSGKLTFITVRAHSIWKLREMLDPQSGVLIELPPMTELRSDLCTPTYRVTGGKIYVELKEDVKKRLPDRRSPDVGDAAVLAICNLGVGRKKRKVCVS